MTHPALHHFAQSLESGARCPVTLVLSSVVVTGVAVKRAAFFDATPRATANSVVFVTTGPVTSQ